MVFLVEVPGLVSAPDDLVSLDPAQLGPVTLRHLVVPDTRHAAQGRGGLVIVPEQLSLGRLHEK